MKNRNTRSGKTILAVLLAQAIFTVASGQTAREIVQKAYEKFTGEESSYSTMNMTIVRPTWERTVTFKSWTKGKDYALTLITGPASEKGQSFLKRKNEMWNWNPTIDRLIKLPPSMMSQGWMGSDYTNDDILRESSIVDDYTHEIIGEEKIEGRDCYKIKLTPREEAAVVWGHQIRWIDKKDYLTLKVELYDEDGYLVRTETGSEIKQMGGRLLPARLELIPADEEGHKTIIVIDHMEFNIPLDDRFFSQQNMKRVR
ncbi:MAG TPA: outer membrane lipoprotein-sorting protein [Bacteroidetes bacterium]|nr:outer membrane lipoprotein-sorting protein [Bacteroidota bacterium]